MPKRNEKLIADIKEKEFGMKYLSDFSAQEQELYNSYNESYGKQQLNGLEIAYQNAKDKYKKKLQANERLEDTRRYGESGTIKNQKELLLNFCKENHKKYFWWLFYIFSGLAVMAKGLPGFVVPFGSMFFITIVSKKFKEIFKPQYLIIGFVLFFLITIPWHVLMLKTYDPLFWNEYVIKHHLARFLGTEGVINRTQPFYFYFLTILWGFFPWIVSCVTVWIKDLINIIKKKEYKCRIIPPIIISSLQA